MRVQALLAASIPLVVAAVAAACSAPINPNALGGDNNPDDGQGASTGPGGSSQTTADGGKPGTQGGGGGGGLPCDVSAIMQQNCALCHGSTPAYGAPSALVTYADLTAPDKIDPTKKVYEAVKARVHATSWTMPPSPSSPLSAQDLATIDAWIAAGTPPSNDSCEGSGADAGPPPKQLSCKPDQFIRSPSPFTMPPNTQDVYMCYGFDVTPAQKRHVVGFGPHIDNPKIVHHLLLFQSDTAYSTTPQECSATTSVGWRLVSGWAPGGQPMETPPEAGFPEEGATHWILQVHYNNAAGTNAGQVDKSGYDLCTTDQLRPNDADVMALGTLSANIPPRAMTDITCEWDPTYIGNIHVFSTTPHMHKLGKIMSTYVQRGGQSMKLVDQQNFDFNYQTAYPASLDFQDGDKIMTRCGWNNTTDQTVKWGENTGDEMCFNFVSYYPKLSLPLWSWTSPSMLATCNPTK